MANPFITMLDEREWLLTDGATGTNLFALGLQHGDAPEAWNLHEIGKVAAHYRSFVEAGSDIVLTNSFGGTANRLKLHGLEGQVREINRAAAAILREEADRSGRRVIVAGDVGPTGDLFQPIGPLTHEDGVEAFSAQMAGLAEGGADVLWIETMSSEDELNAALDAAAATGLPIVTTLSFDTNGRTMMGIAPSRLCEMVHGHTHPPHAFGGNCGTGAADLLAGILSAQSEIQPGDILVAKANCGVPEFVDGAIRYSGTEQLMADYACLARDLGVRIIGGCCGTTPDHIRAMRAALETRPRGAKPGLDEITAALGPLTGSTMDLFAARPAADAAPRRGRRGRRGAA